MVDDLSDPLSDIEEEEEDEATVVEEEQPTESDNGNPAGAHRRSGGGGRRAPRLASHEEALTAEQARALRGMLRAKALPEARGAEDFGSPHRRSRCRRCRGAAGAGGTERSEEANVLHVGASE